MFVIFVGLALLLIPTVLVVFAARMRAERAADRHFHLTNVGQASYRVLFDDRSVPASRFSFPAQR